MKWISSTNNKSKLRSKDCTRTEDNLHSGQLNNELCLLKQVLFQSIHFSQLDKEPFDVFRGYDLLG